MNMVCMDYGRGDMLPHATTNLAIGQLVALLQSRAGHGSGHLLLKVQGNVGQLLLDVPDNFTLGSGGEGVATLCTSKNK